MLATTPANLPKTKIEFMYLSDNYCYQLEPSIVERCLEFARGKAAHNKHYELERNADPAKTFAQDSYSKLAEFAASEFLSNFGNPYEVDTKIYKPNEKNWDADLGKRIGVKSTSMNMSSFFLRNTNGASSESWMFQYSNNSGRGGLDKGIFGLSEEQQKEKMLVFVTVEEEDIKPSTKVWIRGVWNLKDLFDFNLFKYPIKENLKKLKRSIYDGDLKVCQLHHINKASNTPT